MCNRERERDTEIEKETGRCVQGVCLYDCVCVCVCVFDYKCQPSSASLNSVNNSDKNNVKTE